MNESTHPSPELLASFVDGRLAGEERRAMVAHLDACPDCYEVFAETVRFQGEEEPRGQVLRPPRLAAKRWQRWAAAAAAVVAVAIAVAIALPVLRMEPERDLFLASGTLVAGIEVPEGAGLAGTLWPARPGGGPSFGGEQPHEGDPLWTGVRLVDLRAAVRAGDEEAARVAADRLVKELEAAGVAAELEEPIQDAWEAAERGRLEALENAAAELEAGVEEVLDPFQLAFGKWAEAGRLAAAVGDRGFFRSPEFKGFREELEARELSETAAVVLRQIDALTRGDLGPPEAMEELEEAFRQLIRSS
jgi:hypothetical protein